MWRLLLFLPQGAGLSCPGGSRPRGGQGRLSASRSWVALDIVFNVSDGGTDLRTPPPPLPPAAQPRLDEDSERGGQRPGSGLISAFPK